MKEFITQEQFEEFANTLLGRIQILEEELVNLQNKVDDVEAQANSTNDDVRYLERKYEHL
jgi:phage shock protein A